MPTELLPIAVLLAIAPGYLTIYFAARGRTGQPLEPDLHLVLQSLAVSAAILAVLGPPAYVIVLASQANRVALALWAAFWMVLIVLVAPFALGWAARQFIAWSDLNPTRGISKTFRLMVSKPTPPTLWDWASLEKVIDGKFLVIEFTDGRMIAGSYGLPGVAMTSPEQHGVFLASEYQLGQNGVPTTRIQASSGVLVPLDRDVRAIRVFDFQRKGDPIVGNEPETKIAVPDNTKGIIPAAQPAPTQTSTPTQQPAPTRQQQPAQQGDSGKK